MYFLIFSQVGPTTPTPEDTSGALLDAFSFMTFHHPWLVLVGGCVLIAAIFGWFIWTMRRDHREAEAGSLHDFGRKRLRGDARNDN
jgi:hypothetical protein